MAIYIVAAYRNSDEACMGFKMFVDRPAKANEEAELIWQFHNETNDVPTRDKSAGGLTTLFGKLSDKVYVTVTKYKEGEEFQPTDCRW